MGFRLHGLPLSVFEDILNQMSPEEHIFLCNASKKSKQSVNRVTMKHDMFISEYDGYVEYGYGFNISPIPLGRFEAMIRGNVSIMNRLAESLFTDVSEGMQPNSLFCCVYKLQNGILATESHWDSRFVKKDSTRYPNLAVVHYEKCKSLPEFQEVLEMANSDFLCNEIFIKDASWMTSSDLNLILDINTVKFNGIKISSEEMNGFLKNWLEKWEKGETQLTELEMETDEILDASIVVEGIEAFRMDPETNKSIRMLPFKECYRITVTRPNGVLPLYACFKDNSVLMYSD